VTEQLTITSTDSLRLEAALDVPGPSELTGALVLCHPHPRYGGTMNAPLLLALRDRACDAGWSVLRFNFRGLGLSEGESSTGEPEVADASGAIEFMHTRFEQMPVALAGWSFGAAVAVRAAIQEAGLAGLVAIAPSVHAKPEITAGLPEANEVKIRAPTLVVCGAKDELIAPQDCRQWAAVVGARYEEIPAANHFFWGRYDELGNVFVDFLEEIT
jgi:alpha/beta superfamily hydrolase